MSLIKSIHHGLHHRLCDMFIPQIGHKPTSYLIINLEDRLRLSLTNFSYTQSK